MPGFDRRSARAGLAVAALLLIAATPEPTELSTGACVGGHAYVRVNTTTYGVANDQCFLPTACAQDVAANDHLDTPPAGYSFDIRVPIPSTSGELTCYV